MTSSCVQQLSFVTTCLCGVNVNLLFGFQAANCPPALAVLSWTPEGATETVAWVGKGIVYDTGGLSIKSKVTNHTYITIYHNLIYSARTTVNHRVKTRCGSVKAIKQDIATNHCQIERYSRKTPLRTEMLLEIA